MADILKQLDANQNTSSVYFGEIDAFMQTGIFRVYVNGNFIIAKKTLSDEVGIGTKVVVTKYGNEYLITGILHGIKSTRREVLVSG
jgi:hypothetical protein